MKETLDASLTQDKEGRKLNHYVLKHVLGTGSFGQVSLGIDTIQNTQVAVKEFSKTKLKKQSMKQLFGRGRGRGKPVVVNPIDMLRGEIAILKKLTHRNVVRLFEVLDDPNHDSLFMVFELCSKGPVVNVERNTVLDTTKCRNYFQQLVLGIEYLHANDIAHRDIKPDNMLVSHDDIVKIVDFGVSELFSKSTETVKSVAGTPAFNSPELLNTTLKDIDYCACDVWAMGVSLYCMAFGKLPFNGNSIIELHQSIQTHELEKKPDSRITIGQIRVHPWVTDNNRSPLISKVQNCSQLVSEITEADIEQAVKPLTSIFTVLKAAHRLKQMGKKHV